MGAPDSCRMGSNFSLVRRLRGSSCMDFTATVASLLEGRRLAPGGWISRLPWPAVSAGAGSLGCVRGMACWEFERPARLTWGSWVCWPAAAAGTRSMDCEAALACWEEDRETKIGWAAFTAWSPEEGSAADTRGVGFNSG